MPHVTITVLIPTWQRPTSLARCLKATARQSRPADQVIVTVRRDDRLTLDTLPALQAELGSILHIVQTPPVNLRDAMNLGIAQTTGDLVALTDDDVEPHADWLEKLSAAFTSDDIGGVGGRDWQPHERWDETDVGTVSWYGRVRGNHHLGAGPAREVELLKGANCCFRGDLLRKIGLDTRLLGKGNVSHWEMSLCFAIRRAGYKLIYDPAIAVDHHVETRHDGDVNARGGFERESFVDGVHNEALAMLTQLHGVRRLSFRVWAHLVGTIATPGFLQVVRRMIKCNDTRAQACARYVAVREGFRMAHETLRRTKNLHAKDAGGKCASNV